MIVMLNPQIIWLRNILSLRIHGWTGYSFQETSLMRNGPEWDRLIKPLYFYSHPRLQFKPFFSSQFTGLDTKKNRNFLILLLKVWCLFVTTDASHTHPGSILNIIFSKSNPLSLVYIHLSTIFDFLIFYK